jgi:predicted transcriptional regulator
MSTISIEPTLRTRVEQIAQRLGKPAEEIVEEAIQEHLDHLDLQKLQEEGAAFKQMHADLKARYFNQYVAVHQGQVVDSDAEFEPLVLRVQSQFGDVPIYISRVAETPEVEWRFRSIRMESTL